MSQQCTGLSSSTSAAESRDSALQHISWDLADSGYDPEEQHEILDPVEESIRDHWDEVLRDGIRRAFRLGAEDASEWVTDELASRVDYEDVPKEYRQEVKQAVERRLTEKETQLQETLDGLVHDTLVRATGVTEDDLISWGAVV